MPWQCVRACVCDIVVSYTTTCLECRHYCCHLRCSRNTIKYGNVKSHFFYSRKNNIEHIFIVRIWFDCFLENFIVRMSLNQDSSTWSATDAKDNQQEIAKMVRFFYINFSIFSVIEILTIWYVFLLLFECTFRLMIYQSKRMVKQSQKMMALMLRSKYK